MPNQNFLDFIVSEISAFIRTDGHTDEQADMTGPTRLVFLIKNMVGDASIYLLYTFRQV